MIFFRLFFILLLSVSIQANSTSDGREHGNLLEHSQIYIDNSNSLQIEDVLKGKVEFKKNDKKLLAYGYSPDFTVWIKFSLKNGTNKPLYKVIEYDNTLTTNVEFYNPNRDYAVEKEGLFNVKTDRKTLNPVFEVKINPQDTQIYYMRVSSHITTLIVKLNIWDNKTFYEKEIKHQVVLALFFGAMMILAIYNIFIFLFTRDISYLFYFLYVVGISAHHVIYVGIGNVYILNQTWILYIITYASFLTAFPIFVLALFTKTFLHMKQYARLDKILNIFIVILPVSVFLFTITEEYNKFRNVLPIILMIYLLYITSYAALRKNRQAYFILFGWLAICLAIIFMLLSSSGIFNIFEYVYYYIEASLLFEATIFSIALAYRIKQLQEEKVRASKKLIVQQKNETKRLAVQVEEKTAHIGVALEEKQLLLKELHHRVKNNMQMIVSLIRLQKDKVKDNKLQDVLLTIQNRISAMSHLHELLFEQENATHIDTYEYFDLMIESIRDSYHHDLKIELNIKAKLKMEEAIYCGLILNELITNSFKYAFPEKDGTIEVSLKKRMVIIS